MRSSRIKYGTTSSTQQRELVVGDYTYRHDLHQTPQSSFVEECFEKRRSLKLGQDLRSDATSQKNSAGCFRFETQVTGFSAEDGNENVEGLRTHGALAG